MVGKGFIQVNIHFQELESTRMLFKSRLWETEAELSFQDGENIICPECARKKMMEEIEAEWTQFWTYTQRAHVKEPKFVVCVFVMCYNTCFSFRERCMDADNAAFIWLFVMYVCVILLNMFFFFPIVRTKKIHLFHIFVMVLFQKTTFLLHSC